MKTNGLPTHRETTTFIIVDLHQLVFNRFRQYQNLFDKKLLVPQATGDGKRSKTTI